MSGPDPRDRVAFVLCTEPGLLARKSVVLVKTLRRFGGRFADCAVLSYSPREGRVPDRTTLDALHGLGVETVVEPLNRRMADYGFGNKVVACAHAEEAGRFERLVFLDSDTFVLREPTALDPGGTAAVRACPVEKKLAGSTGSDAHAPYWREAFRWAGVEEPGRVETTLTGERIWAYWNAGVVSGPTDRGFFGEWLHVLHGLAADGPAHPLGSTFLDQIALALTLARPEHTVDPLPWTYNFPVNASTRRRDGAPDTAASGREGETPPTPGDIVVAHYHGAFDYFPRRNPLGDRLPPDRAAEIDRMLVESGLVGWRPWLAYRVGHRVRSLLSTVGIGRDR